MSTVRKSVEWVLGVAASFIAVAAASWVLVKPALMAQVAVELKDSIDRSVENSVKKHVEPLSNGFKVIIQQRILELQRDIAELERLSAANPQAFTRDQARELVDKRSQLAAQLMALEAL